MCSRLRGANVWEERTAAAEAAGALRTLWFQIEHKRSYNAKLNSSKSSKKLHLDKEAPKVKAKMVLLRLRKGQSIYSEHVGNLTAAHRLDTHST